MRTQEKSICQCKVQLEIGKGAMSPAIFKLQNQRVATLSPVGKEVGL